jgi:ribonucleoside-diphosphate reductase alpha chain
MAKEGSTVSGLMDSFATAISLALQHGVPLRVLCEKFAHTRFEPSGWTGNPEIGYAKSIMDYIFRWIQMRFLSGTQLDLFAGLTPPARVPVEGTVTAPGNTVSLASGDGLAHSASVSGDEEPPVAPVAAVDAPARVAAPRALQHNNVPSALASLAATADVSPQAILQREARSQQSISDQDIFNNGGAKTHASPYDRTRTTSDAAARSGLAEGTADSFQDRGQYHVADRLKEMYEMGDSPSCATCGAIMTRSGSCYRCMSCGSTSGCS